MNTNKKTYITPAVKEYEMGTLSVFAGSAAYQKAAAVQQISDGFWENSQTSPSAQ